MPSRRLSAFWISIGVITFLYLAFILALLGVTATYTTPADIWKALSPPPPDPPRPYYIGHAIILSLETCTASALLALLVATPVGYLLSRGRFRGKALLDAALDIPIVLPPMVVGLCLLIFFQTLVGRFIEGRDVSLVFRGTTIGPFRSPLPFPFTYTVAGVVLAQFIIGAAFAVRTMRGTFDHLSSRPEDVAMTLGCSRGRAVWLVTLPAARRGMFAAFSIAWARSLGEFGPILVFAGATRMKTEVLPTTVWLELSVGHLEAAVAVSLLMVALAMVVLVAVRLVGEKV